jgi:WD40 repeat protein
VVAATGHWRPVDGVQFSADGTRLFSQVGIRPRLAPEEVIAWDTATWKQRTTTRHVQFEGRRDYLLALSNDHRRGVRYEGDEIRPYLFVHDTQADDRLCKLDIPVLGDIREGTWMSPDGRLVMARLADKKHGLFDGRTGKRVCTIPDVALHFAPVAVAPDHGHLASFSEEGVFRVVAVATGQVVRRLGEPWAVENHRWIRAAGAFSPTGPHLATWKADDDVVLWDLTTGKQRYRLAAEVSRDRSAHLAFSPDGRALAVGGLAGQKDVLVYEAATGLLRLRLSGHAGTVNGLAFSPDGRWLASASDDTTVLVWDMLAPR